MNYLAYQQDGFNSSGDYRLPQKVRLLKRLFYDSQSQLTLDAFRLDKNAVAELSGILVDFAVDVHNDIGIGADLTQPSTAKSLTAGGVPTADEQRPA